VKNDVTSDLEFFVQLARLGSLSAAARALDLTPPAATRRLALMEQRLGEQRAIDPNRILQTFPLCFASGSSVTSW